MFPEFLPMQRTISADGAFSETVGTEDPRRNVVGARQFPMQSFPGELTSCGAIFRNPFRTPGHQDEYKAVCRWEQFEFSVVK